jgi:hypothetical protein
MENAEITVTKSFLSELKGAIIEAIASEDGLDGADGTYLLSQINDLLDLPEDDTNRLYMKHQFYTRLGNRWGLEDFLDHEDFFDLIYELDFPGFAPKNSMLYIGETVFVISQTLMIPEENRILYLLREK